MPTRRRRLRCSKRWRRRSLMLFGVETCRRRLKGVGRGPPVKPTGDTVDGPGMNVAREFIVHCVFIPCAVHGQSLAPVSPEAGNQLVSNSAPKLEVGWFQNWRTITGGNKARSDHLASTTARQTSGQAAAETRLTVVRRYRRGWDTVCIQAGLSWKKT